jgi:hypothetical protein
VLKESEPGFSREKSIDSKLIEQFFTNSDSLFPNEDEMDDYNLEQAKTVEEIFYIIEKMIPDIEKQVITLLFFYKKKQEQVGRILKISQEMVYYYKKRALSRIKLHFFLRSIDIHDMEEFLVKNVTKKQKNAMIEYFKEHDLRKIAKKIAILEGKKEVVYEAIGSRITLGTLKLKELTSAKCQEVRTKAKLYFNVFSILRKYNSLYHTQSKRKISTEIHSK